MQKMDFDQKRSDSEKHIDNTLVSKLTLKE